MPKKNVESLYDVLFNMRAAMEDICQDAEGLLNDVSEYGGELNRVVKEQLSKYFIPGISKLIKDEQTPGSIIGLIRFLDSLPLAMTRINPSIENVAPIVPENPKLVEPAAATNPVDTLPQNASYQKQPVQQPQGVVARESKKEVNNKKFAEAREFVSPSDIFKAILKDTDNLKNGPFGNNDTKFSDYGFELESQVSDYIVKYDPKTGKWEVFSSYYDDNSYDSHENGEDWNSLIDTIFDSDNSWFRYCENPKETYYIENFKLNESKK